MTTYSATLRARIRKATLRAAIVIFLVSAVFVALSRVPHTSFGWALVPVGVFYIWIWWSAIVFVLDSRHVRVIPYFDRKVLDNVHTFSTGHSIGSSLDALESLATAAGVLPISAFGFNDDLSGGQIVWHKPENGIDALRSLLAVVKADEPFDVPGVRSDIKLIIERLEEAARQNARFCFLLRYGDAMSLHEASIRKGHF